jgi:hypothetical protein
MFSFGTEEEAAAQVAGAEETAGKDSPVAWEEKEMEGEAGQGSDEAAHKSGAAPRAFKEASAPAHQVIASEEKPRVPEEQPSKQPSSSTRAGAGKVRKRRGGKLRAHSAAAASDDGKDAKSGSEIGEAVIKTSVAARKKGSKGATLNRHDGAGHNETHRAVPVQTAVAKGSVEGTESPPKADTASVAEVDLATLTVSPIPRASLSHTLLVAICTTSVVNMVWHQLQRVFIGMKY